MHSGRNVMIARSQSCKRSSNANANVVSEFGQEVGHHPSRERQFGMMCAHSGSPQEKGTNTARVGECDESLKSSGNFALQKCKQ